MALYFNITGASSAAAELTRELIAPGDDVRVSSISLTNVHAELPIGATLVHGFTLNNKPNEFGLYLKLTKSASEIPSVDVVIN